MDKNNKNELIAITDNPRQLGYRMKDVVIAVLQRISPIDITVIVNCNETCSSSNNVVDEGKCRLGGGDSNDKRTTLFPQTYPIHLSYYHHHVVVHGFTDYLDRRRFHQSRRCRGRSRPRGARRRWTPSSQKLAESRCWRRRTRLPQVGGGCASL